MNRSDLEHSNGVNAITFVHDSDGSLLAADQQDNIFGVSHVSDDDINTVVIESLLDGERVVELHFAPGNAYNARNWLNDCSVTWDGDMVVVLSGNRETLRATRAALAVSHDLR